MLKQITDLLLERGSLSVKEIALALVIDVGALRPMLELLEQKGRIKKIALPCGGGCSSCNCADMDNLTYYKAA